MQSLRLWIQNSSKLFHSIWLQILFLLIIPAWNSVQQQILPAGFVKQDETVDQAVLREINEETGVKAILTGLIGVRTGVIREEISDNMLIFLLEAEDTTIFIQEEELSDARFLSEEELLNDSTSSLLIKYLIENPPNEPMGVVKGLNPGNQFQYTTYHFIK